MKRILIAAILLVFIGCKEGNTKEGWLVFGQDGKIYRLEPALGTESYRLREVDSAALRRLLSNEFKGGVPPYTYDPIGNSDPLPHKIIITGKITDSFIIKHNK